ASTLAITTRDGSDRALIGALLLRLRAGRECTAGRRARGAARAAPGRVRPPVRSGRRVGADCAAPSAGGTIERPMHGLPHDLVRLAHAWGLLTAYHDVAGRRVLADTEAVLAVLAAL